MTDSKDRSLSRCKWLGLAATASLSPALLAATPALASSPSAPTSKAVNSDQPPPRSAVADSRLSARVYNVRDFGAKGEGITLDTAAIQAAINACNTDQGGIVHVTFVGGGTVEEAAVRDVPKVVGEYYETGVLPAYAFARNVRGLTLSNVRFERPAVVFDHLSGAAVHGFSAQGTKETDSAFRLIETQDVLLTGARVPTPVPVFLGVEGANSQGITLDGGDFSKAATPVAFDRGAH